MASSSSSLVGKIVPKTMVFKFQGVQLKSHFQDALLEIWNTKLGHFDWNSFLVLHKNPNERSPMVSTLIIFGLVNAASHSTLVQSSELVMALEENYVSEERVVKSITGEIILDLRPKCTLDLVSH